MNPKYKKSQQYIYRQMEEAKYQQLHNQPFNLYSRINIFIHEKDIGYPRFCSQLATKPRIDLNDEKSDSTDSSTVTSDNDESIHRNAVINDEFLDTIGEGNTCAIAVSHQNRIKTILENFTNYMKKWENPKSDY